MTIVRLWQNLNVLFFQCALTEQITQNIKSLEPNAGHVTRKIGPLYFKGACINCGNLGLFAVHLQLFSMVFYGRPKQYFVAEKNWVHPGLSNIVLFQSFQFLMNNLML